MTNENIPEGCDRCPNRLPPKRDFLSLTQRSAFALVLSFMLIPCFVEDTDGRIHMKKEPNLPVLIVILPIIGLCLGIDINPGKN